MAILPPNELTAENDRFIEVFLCSFSSALGEKEE